MQFARLLDRQTLEELESNDNIFTCLYTEVVRTNTTGNLKKVLLDDYHKDPDRTNIDTQLRIYSKI